MVDFMSSSGSSFIISPFSGLGTQIHIQCYDIQPILYLTILISCFRYAYTLILSDDIVNQYQAGKLTIGILPLGYTIQSLSTWTVVAVAMDR